MKNRLLRLCRRLNKVVIEDVLPILSVTEKEITPVFEELVAENRLGKRCDGVYFYKEVTKKRLPLFFECRTPAELELIKRCFCADLPCQQTGIILNFSDNVIGKFNKFFREYIYNTQFTKLIDEYQKDPQEPRICSFFDITVYFYHYNGQTYVSKTKLRTRQEKRKLNVFEVREFKKTYLKVRRRIYHNEMVRYMPHHIAEAIARTYMSFDELMTAIV